jgi:drug/metabolite transporter (DMT)-like permease
MKASVSSVSTEESSGKVRLRVIGAWLVLCLIWSSTWLAIKIGLSDLPPLSFCALRFVIAAAILFAICVGRFPIRPRHLADYGFLAVTGLLTFGVNYGLLFWGEQHISSGLAAVLQATIPSFGLVFAHFYLPGEKIKWERALGALLALGGVAIICARVLDFEGTMPLRGGIGIVVGAAGVAYANVVIKARPVWFAPAALAAWQMVFGIVPLLAAGLWFEGNPFRFHWSASAIGCLLYLALVGSVLAFLLFYWLMPRIAVTNLLTISLITPPAAIALGWLFYGEALSPWALVGAAFVLIGVGLILWKTAKPPPPDATKTVAEPRDREPVCNEA